MKKAVQPLTERKCRACEGEPPLPAAEAGELHADVAAWRLGAKDLQRDFRFRDFKEAVDFLNQVAELAEIEGHHPDLLLHGYRNLRITLTTHATGGLSENDFILAAKIDRLV